MSTMELQLASFPFCVACRDARNILVVVNKDMPLSLWGDDDDSDVTPRRRLPILRVTDEKWYMPADMLVPVLIESELMRGVKRLQVVSYFGQGWYSTEDMRGVWQPPRPERSVSPRSVFDVMRSMIDMNRTGALGLWLPRTGGRVLRWGHLKHVVADTSTTGFRLFPIQECLYEIQYSFGGMDTSTLPPDLRLFEGLPTADLVSQLVHPMVYPPRLLELTCHGTFNKPITRIVWPASLMKLTFGHDFNQEIDDVVWPVSLLRLTFGSGFDQQISRVVWPTGLQVLIFGQAFNKPLSDIGWPTSLLDLTLGKSSNRPITDGVLPCSLKRLVFGDMFNFSIIDVVWPPNLRSLAFGRRFNQPVEKALNGRPVWSISSSVRRSIERSRRLNGPTLLSMFHLARLSTSLSPGFIDHLQCGSQNLETRSATRSVGRRSLIPCSG